MSFKLARVLPAVLLCFSISAQAADGLIIWPENDQPFNNTSYKRARQFYHSYSPDVSFDTVFSVPNEGEPLIIEAGRKYSIIVLATHGGSDNSKDQTLLKDLGRIGSNGTEGALRKILEDLGRGGHLAERVHVLLDACSTFCKASDDSAKGRARGLYRELSQYGVKEISIWGADQPLASNWVRGLSLPAVMGKEQKRLAKFIVPMALLLGGAFLHKMNIVESEYDKAMTLWLGKMMGMMVGAPWALATGLNIFQYFTTGIKGRLVRVSDKESTVEAAPILSLAAYTGRACEFAFSR